MEKTYKFDETVTDPSNFINKYINYASQLTDASYDYHEAMAILLLSAATKGLTLNLAQFPGGLRTNLYMILYGHTFISRKSTAMDIAQDILERAIPGCVLPEDFTPQALIENVAKKGELPSVIFADEFQPVIEKMNKQQYMIGLKGFLLTMFKKAEYSYARTAKGSKAKVSDDVNITDGHLCLAGNVTTSISTRFTDSDMEDGFLGRFAIIHPSEKPDRLPLGRQPNIKAIEAKRNDLIMHLSNIFAACQIMKNTDPNLLITVEALKILDRFQEDTELIKIDKESVYNMVQRVADLSIKLAILVRIGQEDPITLSAPTNVISDDALKAVKIAKKWTAWASKFGGSIGYDAVESKISAIMATLSARGAPISRSEISRNFHVRRKDLNEMQMTMVERGMITLKEVEDESTKGRTLYWCIPKVKIKETEEEDAQDA